MKSLFSFLTFIFILAWTITSFGKDLDQAILTSVDNNTKLNLVNMKVSITQNEPGRPTRKPFTAREPGHGHPNLM